MSNAKLLRQLIKTGIEGDVDGFKAASEAVIREEREKKHHLVANDLERLLYGGRSRSRGSFLRLLPVKDLPINKDSGLLLLEERAATRDENDIVLGDAARLALEEILIEYERADILLAHGLQPAQRLLFCGPSGCGKTLAAEVIASALQMPLLVVRLDCVITSLLGETSANLRKVFDYVSSRPVVALFDEFDALSKDRGAGDDHGELKRSVNAVLQMMDSYRGQSILIATTNYETLLDKAVWRRFDEVIRFEPPDLKQIKQLLALKLAGVRRKFDTGDPKIVSLFEGLFYAEKIKP
ncbi:AAA family ATPase [Bartonella sp. DGB2]|uniref:AAA family ATPase n=1 Tax=Bartonella sp. DGB2 TaxID=3388426 RepID=UPI00398FF04D